MEEVVYAVIIVILVCVIIGVSLYSVHQRTTIGSLNKNIEDLEKAKKQVEDDAAALEQMVEKEQHMNAVVQKQLKDLKERKAHIEWRLRMLQRKKRQADGGKVMTNPNPIVTSKPIVLTSEGVASSSSPSPSSNALGIAYRPKNMAVTAIMRDLQALMTDLQLTNCVMLRQMFGKIIDDMAKQIASKPMKCKDLYDSYVAQVNSQVPAGLKASNPNVTPEQTQKIINDLIKLFRTVMYVVCAPQDDTGTIDANKFRQTFADIFDSICYS